MLRNIQEIQQPHKDNLVKIAVTPDNTKIIS